MIHNQLLDNFYLSEEALENSPSRRDGIDRDTEATLRIYGCELIQEGGILLHFQQVVMATGQVLFHRFYCKRSMKSFNVKKVAATALWEAAKLEEVPEVSNHPRELLEKVMVAIDRCTVRRELPDAARLPVLEQGSKEYEEFRRSLIRYETEMLKAFGFITNVEHPHQVLLNFLHVLGVPSAVAQLDAAGDREHALHGFAQHAWNVANDSLRTTLCVRFKGSVVACGIIFFTSRRLRVPLPHGWWELFQVALADVAEVARALYELYLAPKARFIPVCHTLLPSKPPTPGGTGAGSGSGKGAGALSGATPLLGATPDLAVRPGGKALDPSVRRPLVTSDSTPNLPNVLAAAAGATHPAAVVASMQQQAQAVIAALASGSGGAADQQGSRQRDGSRDRERADKGRRRSSRSRSRERRRSRSADRDSQRRRSRSRSHERRRRSSRSRSRDRRRGGGGADRADDRPPRPDGGGRSGASGGGSKGGSIGNGTAASQAPQQQQQAEPRSKPVAVRKKPPPAAAASGDAPAAADGGQAAAEQERTAAGAATTDQPGGTV